MAAAADGELRSRHRRALDRHLAGCVVCGREMASTTTILSALAGLQTEAEVPARLEQATLRQVRLMAGEAEKRPAWWWRLPVPALAFATASVLAVVLAKGRNVPVAPPAAAPPAPARVARATARPVETMARTQSRPVQVAEVPPAEPPPELAAAPDLFMNLQILRHLEKLEHFEAIQMTTVDDAPATPGGDEERSSG